MKASPASKRKKRRALKADLFKLSVSESLRYVCFFAFVVAMGIGVYFSASPLPGCCRFQAAKAPSDLAASMQKIFPDFDNDPLKESFSVSGEKIFPVRRVIEMRDRPSATKLLGFAFRFPTPTGESCFLMAVDRDGRLKGFVRLDGNESEAERQYFSSLRGKTAGDLALRQMVFEMDAASREGDLASARILSEGFHFFEKNKSEILKQAGPGFVSLSERLKEEAP